MKSGPAAPGGLNLPFSPSRCIRFLGIALKAHAPSSLCLQVVWTAGEKSLLLWCAFSGYFLGSIQHGGDSDDPEIPPPGKPGKAGKDEGEREEKRHIDPKKVITDWTCVFGVSSTRSKPRFLRDKQTSNGSEAPQTCFMYTVRTCRGLWPLQLSQLPSFYQNLTFDIPFACWHRVWTWTAQAGR